MMAGSRAGGEAMSGPGAMRPARSVSAKNAPQARPSAAALIRRCPSEHRGAQPIVDRPPDDRSRCGHRQHTRRRRIFPGVGRGAAGPMWLRRIRALTNA
jgi:hypothetical protein